jgi:hypothetical protein
VAPAPFPRGRRAKGRIQRTASFRQALLGAAGSSRVLDQTGEHGKNAVQEAAPRSETVRAKPVGFDEINARHDFVTAGSGDRIEAGFVPRRFPACPFSEGQDHVQRAVWDAPTVALRDASW